MRATFMASTEPGDIGRRVIWEEHENGRVSATQFFAWNEDGGVEITSRGIFEMALRKGYRPPVPDILLARYAEAIRIGGPVFESVSALLTLCEIPLDAERLPMYAGMVSRSP